MYAIFYTYASDFAEEPFDGDYFLLFVSYKIKGLKTVAAC